MKKEISPAVTWTAVVLVVLVVAFFVYKGIAGPAPDMDKKGADATMQKVQAGGKMYEPPPEAVPNSGSGSKGGAVPGGYNMQPPSR